MSNFNCEVMREVLFGKRVPETGLVRRTVQEVSDMLEKYANTIETEAQAVRAITAYINAFVADPPKNKNDLSKLQFFLDRSEITKLIAYAPNCSVHAHKEVTGEYAFVLKVIDGSDTPDATAGWRETFNQIPFHTVIRDKPYSYYRLEELLHWLLSKNPPVHAGGESYTNSRWAYAYYLVCNCNAEGILQIHTNPALWQDTHLYDVIQQATAISTEEYAMLDHDKWAGALYWKLFYENPDTAPSKDVPVIEQAPGSWQDAFWKYLPKELHGGGDSMKKAHVEMCKNWLVQQNDPENVKYFFNDEWAYACYIALMCQPDGKLYGDIAKDTCYMFTVDKATEIYKKLNDADYTLFGKIFDGALYYLLNYADRNANNYKEEESK